MGPGRLVGGWGEAVSSETDKKSVFEFGRGGSLGRGAEGEGVGVLHDVAHALGDDDLAEDVVPQRAHRGLAVGQRRAPEI